MKTLGSLLLLSTSTLVCAGQMGSMHAKPDQPSYVFIGGGYYAGMYQKVDMDYDDGVLESMTAFDASHSNGYGQIGVGTASRIDKFIFDQQVSVLKLGGASVFTSPHSYNKLKQVVDFGYDLLPSISLLEQLNAYGLLGVHYARFQYEKDPLSGTGVVFNNKKDQLGFALGAGLNYRLSQNFMLGVQYQHLQYTRVKVYGTSPSQTEVDAEQFTPAFNLIGANLRYYWDN